LGRQGGPTAVWACKLAETHAALDVGDVKLLLVAA